MPGGRSAKRAGAAEGREPAGAKPPRGGASYYLATVRIDSVRYRKVKELSRIKGLLSHCIPWKKSRRRFPLPRGQVPETTWDGFLKPRRQRFLIPRASAAIGRAATVPKTTSLGKPCRFLIPRARIARQNRAMPPLRPSLFASDSPSGAESGLDLRLRLPPRFLKPRATVPVRSTD